jgi:hypothetical protein
MITPTVLDVIGPKKYYQLVMNTTKILTYLGRVDSAKELIVEALDFLKSLEKLKLENELYDRMQFFAASNLLSQTI